MHESDTVKKVYSLLWSGKAEEAKALISKRRIEILTELSSLDDLLSTSQDESTSLHEPSDREFIAKTGVNLLADQGIHTKLSKSSKIMRRSKILNTALKREPGVQFTSDDIINELRLENYDFQVPENRIATTVGGIISRDERFARINTGVFYRLDEKDQRA
jgi:hypothetical protein